MNAGKILALSSIGIVVAVSYLMYLNSPQTKSRSDENASSLFMYCAAGIRMPVSEVAAQYEKEFGVKVELQFAGSGTLIGNIEASGRGDIYLAADTLHIDKTKEKGLSAESIPVAWQKPVIAVYKDNPKGIKGLADLFREDVKVAQANPEQASVGKITKKFLTKSGKWEQLKANTKVFKPTVNEVANDIKLKAVDAGILWDASVVQYKELIAIPISEFIEAEQNITVTVLNSTKTPTSALHFLRFLTAKDKGLPVFKKYGYRPVDGDTWEEIPKIDFYCGGLNRIAVEKTLKAFQEREGVEINTHYNGCGILVGQMKTKGIKPDAYLSCDMSFVPPVKDLFHPFHIVSETDIVILVAKGNPKAIKEVKDILNEGLKIGMTHPDQSALGNMTMKMLKKKELYQKLQDTNLKVEAPTADLLVNMMRTESLDAAFISHANASQVLDKLDIVKINDPDAVATQPFGIGKDSKHKYLLNRLYKAILSDQSQEMYKSNGFRWRGDSETALEESKITQ